MVIVVLGFHKSGTTLVAKTLHHAGIDMGPVAEGDYPKCKYEDPRVAEITRKILFNGSRRKSIDPSISCNECGEEIKKYVESRANESNWGFKYPDVTLCFNQWKEYLPADHIAIGVIRKLDGVLGHYSKNRNPPSMNAVKAAYGMYYKALLECCVPMVWFEDILRDGPSVIEDAIGITGLPDVRK